MTITIGTYLPPWGSERARVIGYDEDALTMAVEAGRQAIGQNGAVSRVVFISRELPLLEGGNTAPLLAGLSLPNDLEVIEQIGGAPATLDALALATPGTLVIGVDAGTVAGAAAALVGAKNPVVPVKRIQRSMPHHTRLQNGVAYHDDDPRMLRELGVRTSLDAAQLPGKPLLVAGLGVKEAAAFSAAGAPALPTVGASSILFGLAALIDAKRSGLVAASEQGALAAANVDLAGARVNRHEPAAQAPAKRKHTPGGEIKLSLAAYDRAFEAKVGWQAGKCECGTLALPPRHYCLNCGADGKWEYTALPRSGTVYTLSTIHVPVPGLQSPYTLAIVECDGVGVRSLVHVTDVPPGSIKIGDHGRFVLRRVAMRSGVPDYGHAFSPDLKADSKSGGAQ